MTSSPAPEGTTGTLPPLPITEQASAAAPQLPAAAPQLPVRPAHTRISGIRTGMIAGAAGLIVMMIFIIQNTSAVNISFLGAHLRLSLAVALILAAIGGALLMAAAGTARITQLRRIMRRDRNKAQAN